MTRERRRRSGELGTLEPAPVRPRSDRPKKPTRRLLVLGSGADADYGLPTMAALMHELAAFARGEGRPIDKGLRRKLPYLHFAFDRFAGQRGEDTIVQLFSGNDEIAPNLLSAAQKLKADGEMGPVAVVIERLCSMAKSNQLSGASLAGIASLAGEAGQVGSAEPLLDPRKLTLSSVTGNALRRGFQQVFQRVPTLSAEERETLELFIAATSNIEQLLSLFFTGYQDGGSADKKNYLYLAWMLWAFLRVRSSGLGPRQSIYSQLPRLGADVVTFNYTNFFHQEMLGRVRFFHGRLDHYLRLDTRDVVKDDARFLAATEIDRVVALIDTLRLDVQADPAIDIPAIVPPTSFKPVMSRDQLRTWVEADDLIQRADVIVVVGYSFGIADEHFNDLIRKSNQRTRIVVVNPDLDGAAQVVSGILGIDPDQLSRTEEPYNSRRSQRLTCIEAFASDVTPEFLEEVLR